LTTQIQQGNLDALFDLEPFDSEKMEYLGITLHECEKCDEFRTVTINRVTLSFDKDNKLVIVERPIINTLLIDNAAYGRLTGMVEAAEEMRLKMMEETAAAEEQKSADEENTPKDGQ